MDLKTNIEKRLGTTIAGADDKALYYALLGLTKELCSERSALNTIEKIIKRIRQLEDFPEIGAPLSSVINLEVPCRFLVCGNYTAFYKVEGNEVHIIRVLYGRRNVMQILFGKSYDE